MNFAKLMILFVCFQILPLTSNSQRININIGGETGTVDSGVETPLVESYSKNGNSAVEDGSGHFTANDLHYISAKEISWAREGNYALKFYADGSNFPNNDYAYRVELATSPSSLAFSPGDERYYSLSFFPPQVIWDKVTQYSTVISQWKQYGGGDPNAEIRLSNEGDYKLTIRSVRHWNSEDDEGDLFGYAKPDQWNDLKYYVKHSQEADGAIKVWLNGELVYSYIGPTLYKNENGYIKFGMYTEIRDERILYFDGINITDSISVSQEEWATDQLHLPTVEILSPIQNGQLSSGSKITITAQASDPGGNKLGSSGNIEKVDFFVNNNYLGVDSISPYNIDWAPNDGAYSLQAIVMDSDSNVVSSEIVPIYVGAKPPVVSITSPVHLRNFDNVETLTIRADASDIDGSVAQVEFFVGNNSIGIDTSSPYAINWIPADTGAYILRAIATDLDNKKSLADSIGITFGATIDTLQITSIHDAALDDQSPNSVANYSKVEVYSNSTRKVTGIFKFDLSDSLSTHEIRDAKFRVYTNSLDDSLQVSAFKVIGDQWDETSVTLNNGPLREEKITEININQENQYFDFEIKDYIIEKITAGDPYVTIWIEDENRVLKQAQFDSHKRSNPPQLKLITSDITGADIIGRNKQNCNEIHSTDTITTCDNYTWINGITYTESNNTATYTLTSSTGCDSVVILNLTIGEAISSTDIITSCNSYTWIDGLTYTENNNTATHTLTSSTGCDSVITLDLSMLSLSIDAFDPTCHSYNNGEIILNGFQEANKFQYSINGGDRFHSSYIFKGLSDGFYEIIVKDDDQCFVSDTLSLVEPEPLDVIIDILSDSLSAKVKGGVPPYTFSWNNGMNDTVIAITDMEDYRVVVMDSNECIKSDSAFVPITSIDDQEINHQTVMINLFPNPVQVNDRLHFTVDNAYESSRKIDVYIVNSIGQKIYSTTTTSDMNGSLSLVFDLEDKLNSGIYQIFGVSEKNIVSKKLIIEK